MFVKYNIHGDTRFTLTSKKNWSDGRLQNFAKMTHVKHVRRAVHVLRNPMKVNLPM